MAGGTRIEMTAKIDAPVEVVSNLLEDVRRTSEWNPLVSRIVPKAKGGRGIASTLSWEGVVAGIPIHGSSEAVAWSPGKKYSWRNEGQVRGHEGKRLLSRVDGTFFLKPAGTRTQLRAVVSYSISKAARPLINDKTVRDVLAQGVEGALGAINRLARKSRPRVRARHT